MTVIVLDTNEPPLNVEYTFTYELEASDLSDAYLLMPTYQVGNTIKYAIRTMDYETEHPKLWITGTEISFDARVLNLGNPNALAEWKAGFIQSIYKSDRDAHYAGNLHRRFKLDTSFGPLMDGSAPPFYKTPKAFVGKEKVHVTMSDAPNFRVPVVYGPNNAQLQRTSGLDYFCTFLALARERDKSIVTLASAAWIIDWGGVFHGVNTQQPWQPTAAASFFQVGAIDRTPAVYLRMAGNPAHAPFSLLMTEAESFSKILDNGEWKKCGIHGDLDKAAVTTLQTWRTT